MQGSRSIASAGVCAQRAFILLLFLLVASITAIWLFGATVGGGGNRPMPSLPFRSAPGGDFDELRRNRLMCGPNSLYMLMSLHDVPIDYGAMEKDISWHSQGMSLLDLQKTSSTLGLRTEVRYCSINELRRGFRSPVIACLEIGSRYHYVVVIEITDDSLTMLDGTTGERNTVPRRWLNAFWSGYVLVPDSGFSASWLILAVPLFVWLLLGFLTSKRNRRATAATIVFVMWVLFGRSLAVAAKPPDGQQEVNPDRAAFYRTPENDAVNCLYLQLRLLGYTESYEAFREQLPDEPRFLSLESLADLGRKLGFRLVPVKMTVSELVKAKLPVIVHFEESGIGSGRFLLFLGMDETRVDVIDGSYVTFEQMSCSRFRRNWSGYALVGQPPFDWQVWLRRCAAVLAIAGIAIRLLIGKVWFLFNVVRLRG